MLFHFYRVCPNYVETAFQFGQRISRNEEYIREACVRRIRVENMGPAKPNSFKPIISGMRAKRSLLIYCSKNLHSDGRARNPLYSTPFRKE